MVESVTLVKYAVFVGHINQELEMIRSIIVPIGKSCWLALILALTYSTLGQRSALPAEPNSIHPQHSSLTVLEINDGADD